MALFQVQLTAVAKRQSRSIVQLLLDDSRHAFDKKRRKKKKDVHLLLNGSGGLLEEAFLRIEKENEAH